MKKKKSFTLCGFAPLFLLGIGTVGIVGIVLGAVLLAVVVGVVVPIALERKKSKAPAKAQPAPQAKKKAQPASTPAPAQKVQSAPVAQARPAPAAAAQPAPVQAPVAQKPQAPVAKPKPAAKEEPAGPQPAATQKARPFEARYNKSFTAKLIQSDEQTKRYYSEIKNHLLSYRGVRSKIGWKWEAFRKGRETLVKLRLRGKTLSVCFALDADDYAGTKYRVEKADAKSLAATPCLYRVKNDRRLRYTKDLADTLLQSRGAEKSAVTPVDYARQYPFETTQALLAKKLVKVVGKAQPAALPIAPMQSVAAQDVDALMRDEVASALIVRSDAKSDKTKSGIVNIDVLSQCFKRGETVTLAEIKKRVKGFSKNITFVKVLARGTLDKPLTVEADGFSLQAVKMIALTGGTAVKKS